VVRPNKLAADFIFISEKMKKFPDGSNRGRQLDNLKPVDFDMDKQSIESLRIPESTGI
jgi:hypothetical protein